VDGTSRRPHLLADARADALGLLGEDLEDEIGGDDATILELRAVVYPLPDLRAQISAVAASSMRLSIAAAPRPLSQNEM